VKEGQKSRR